MIVVGRVKTYEAIVKGQQRAETGRAGILQGIDQGIAVAWRWMSKYWIKTIEEIDLKQTFDDDDDVGLAPYGRRSDGYGTREE